MYVAAGGRRFTWPFLIADVALPVIGADILQHFGLLVDLGEMRLMARKGSWSQHLVAPSGSGMFATIGVVADKSPQCARAKKKEHTGAAPAARVATSHGGSFSLQHMLEEFPKVLNTSKVLPKPTHRLQHFLITEGRPVTAKYRRLDNDRA